MNRTTKQAFQILQWNDATGRWDTIDYEGTLNQAFLSADMFRTIKGGYFRVYDTDAQKVVVR